jgi:integrase
MADLTLAFVRKIFNWHASRVDDFNSPITPAMGRYDAKANQGTRVLTDNELRAIWQATEGRQPFHALVRFLLLTGARRNEARYLSRCEVDSAVWTLPPARNKTKVELVRPLSRAAQRVLETVPTINGGDLVFSHDGRRPMSFTQPTARLRTASGTAGWRIHDLRRTFRTLASRAGINADVAERCLGHTIGGVRGIYDKHQYQTEMARAYDAVASLLARIVNPPAGVVTPLRRSR